MTIQEMQEAILAKGWQFQEHVFNDGSYGNCHLELTDSKDPLSLLSMLSEGRIAWGRFERNYCWTRAYRWIILGETK